MLTTACLDLANFALTLSWKITVDDSTTTYESPCTSLARYARFVQALQNVVAGKLVAEPRGTDIAATKEALQWEGSIVVAEVGVGRGSVEMAQWILWAIDAKAIALVFIDVSQETFES